MQNSASQVAFTTNSLNMVVDVSHSTATCIQTEDAPIEKCVPTNPISCTNQILVHL